jgi:hypothetical protein
MKKLIAFLIFTSSLNAFALDCSNLATTADKQAALAGGCSTPVISVYGYGIPSSYNQLVSNMYDPNTNDVSVTSGVYADFWSDGQGNQVKAGTWRNYSSTHNNSMVAWSSPELNSWACPRGTATSTYANVCVPLANTQPAGSYYSQPVSYCMNNPQYCGGDATAPTPTSGPVYALLYPAPPTGGGSPPPSGSPVDAIAMTSAAVASMQLLVLAMVTFLGLLLLAITFSHFALRKGWRSASGKV